MKKLSLEDLKLKMPGHWLTDNLAFILDIPDGIYMYLYYGESAIPCQKWHLMDDDKSIFTSDLAVAIRFYNNYANLKNFK